MVLKEFPPWQNVYRAFRRWSEQGRSEQMHDRLPDGAEARGWVTEARWLMRRLTV